MWRCVLLHIILYTCSGYSINEHNKGWTVSQEGTTISQGGSNIINQHFMPDFSILDVNLLEILNVQGINVINSLQSQIRFSGSVEEIVLSFNQTHTNIAFDGERQFAFSGFKQVFFKGECSRWKIIFKDAGEEQHKEKDTINVRGANVENLHLLRIESKNNYFPEIFLTTKNMQEVQMFGMEKGEEFAITSITTMEEKEIEKKADVLLERGGIHAIIFETPPDDTPTPISSLLPIEGVYYGTNIIVDRAGICPLVINANTISVPVGLSCTGLDEIRFISCNVMVEDVGSITTELGNISFECQNLPNDDSTTSYFVGGRISTQANFLVNGIRMIIENTAVTAASASIQLTGTRVENHALTITRSDLIIGQDVIVVAKGSARGSGFLVDTARIRAASIKVVATSDDGTAVSFGGTSLECAALDLNARGRVGLLNTGNLLVDTGAIINVVGIDMGAFLDCSSGCKFTAVKTFVAEGSTAVKVFGRFEMVAARGPTFNATGDIYLDDSASFSYTTDDKLNAYVISASSGLFLGPGAQIILSPNVKLLIQNPDDGSKPDNICINAQAGSIIQSSTGNIGIECTTT